MAQGKLTSGLRNGVRNWALRRQGADRLPLTLQARRVYIVPTSAGWTFALLILVTFVAGMNYGNGLAMLFSFWLTGFALVAMVQTQRNLAGTQLLDASALPAFAGAAVAIALSVATRGAAADLSLSAEDARMPAADPAEIPADILHLQITARRRGPWRAPLLRLTSTAPFGLFRTWTWLRLDVATLVYPQLAGNLPVPETAGEETGTGYMTTGQDELAWLRDFRDGDSPRQVAWKAYARGAPLLVREYRGHAAASRDLDFSALTGLDVEARLSQLACWCVEAAARGERWTLRLPGSAALAGAGPHHLQQCLQQLALHDHHGTAS